MTYYVLAYRDKGTITTFLNDHLKRGIKAHLRARENSIVNQIGLDRNETIHSISHHGTVFVCSDNRESGNKVFFSDLSEEHAKELQEFSEYIDHTYRQLASAGGFISRVVNRQANTFGDLRELLPSFLSGAIYQNFAVPERLEYVSEPEKISAFKQKNQPKLALLTELNLISTMVT